MALKVAVSAAPVGIQQTVAAGSAFDGTLPTTAISYSNGINKFGEDVAGGLIYFENRKPISLISYQASFGGEVPYRVSIVSLDGNGAKIESERVVVAEGVGSLVTGPVPFGFIIGPYQALEIMTDGPTGAAMALSAWAIDATAMLVG